jgi:hypothetical protein
MLVRFLSFSFHPPNHQGVFSAAIASFTRRWIAQLHTSSSGSPHPGAAGFTTTDPPPLPLGSAPATGWLSGDVTQYRYMYDEGGGKGLSTRSQTAPRYQLLAPMKEKTGFYPERLIGCPADWHGMTGATVRPYPVKRPLTPQTSF